MNDRPHQRNSQRLPVVFDPVLHSTVQARVPPLVSWLAPAAHPSYAVPPPALAMPADPLSHWAGVATQRALPDALAPYSQVISLAGTAAPAAPMDVLPPALMAD